MKKILFIVTQSEFGGAQRYVFELASRLNPEKYDILVAAGQGNGELLRKLQKSKIATIKLKWLKRAPWPHQILISILEILNLLKKEKPNILFLCSTTAGLTGSIASFLYKHQFSNIKPQTIYRIGGWAFNDPRNWFLNKLILEAEKLTAPFKDKIIVNSEFDRKSAIEKGICSPKKIIRIYNGIDPEKLSFLSKKQAREKIIQLSTSNIQVSSQSRIVGTVANFYRTKGINYLIEGIKLLEAKYRPLDVNCIVIGEGKQRPELESLIKKLGLTNKVFLAGRIPEAYKYLKAFDLFILPSLKEGFPWIILEVMAAEIPIIATKVGAIPEIIENNKQGILINPSNPEQIAEQINKLINNSEFVQTLKIQAKQKLKEFSVLKMIQETKSLF